MLKNSGVFPKSGGENDRVEKLLGERVVEVFMSLISTTFPLSTWLHPCLSLEGVEML